MKKDNGLLLGHAALFATLIARTAKDIDFLIESLPSEECSPELQVRSVCFLIVCLHLFFFFKLELKNTVNSTSQHQQMKMLL